MLESLGDYECTAEGAFLGSYTFKKKNHVEIRPVKENEDWNRGMVLAKAQNIARDLANTPANLMTPSLFAQAAANLFLQREVHGFVQLHIRNKNWLQDQRMGGVLAVAQGSEEPPAFLEIIYNPQEQSNSPLVYVGKGVTFDTGGISIKSASDMHIMKGDMSGAASVVGAIYGLALLQAPIHVVGIIPLVENLVI